MKLRGDAAVTGDQTVSGALAHAGSTLGLLGASPVAQQAHIDDPSGGLTSDGQARAAINKIIDVLEAYGLTASA